MTVNGKETGYVGWQPCECDVTGSLRPGTNTIEVTVIGTLKNTLGPHHAGKMAGTAWPAMFHQGPETGPPPGAAYDTLGYGLFEPFVLRERQGGVARLAGGLPAVRCRRQPTHSTAGKPARLNDDAMQPALNTPAW